MALDRFGAWLDAGGAHFRVWAPSAARVELVIEGFDQPVAMTPAATGVFSADLRGPGGGSRYRYRVDGKGPFPDPASRWQPDGVHGASAIDDPGTFAWRSAPLRVSRRDLVIYELHTGTFTPEGTFDGVRGKLPYLRDLGITAIELMPIADFPGSRNWGYDGAALFAPSRAYGGPAGLRRLVDAAHQLDLAVLLDVVYNHLGPDGAYLKDISPEFFETHASNPWGDSVNLSEPMVRSWLTANAAQWAIDYQIDGFRLDATHALPGSDAPAFLRRMIHDVRAEAGRDVVFIAEDHRNLADMLRGPAEGGWGLDAVWADDFHHHVRVIAAGDSYGYYRDYRGEAHELAETINRGWFFCGQHSEHLGGPRGTDPSGLSPDQFVVCIQNHDQIGNRALGDRLHHRAPLDAWRAASALLLLAPQTPMLFMGQEWAATSPFQYFTDHGEPLGRQVREGRRNEFRDFPEFSDRPDAIPDPQADATFLDSRLSWHEQDLPPHAESLHLYRTLLALRRSERQLQPEAFAMDAHTLALPLAHGTLIVRLKGSGRVELGDRLRGSWRIRLTTEDREFGGATPPVLDGGAVTFACPAALVINRA